MPSGQPSGERIIWDDLNEKHLLLCILAEANPTKLDWARISVRFGKNLTSGAASQKYAKIKTRDKELFEGGGGLTTPSKVTKSTPKASAKRASNGKVKPVDHGEDNESDEYLQTPSKKMRTVKMEDVSDDCASVMDDEV